MAHDFGGCAGQSPAQRLGIAMRCVLVRVDRIMERTFCAAPLSARCSCLPDRAPKQSHLNVLIGSPCERLDTRQMDASAVLPATWGSIMETEPMPGCLESFVHAEEVERR